MSTKIYSYEQRDLVTMLGQYIGNDGDGRTYRVVKNVSGGTLEAGDVVIYDMTLENDNEVTTTTQSASPLVAGVVAEDTVGTVADDAYCLICVDGVQGAKVTGASGGTHPGDRLQTHTVAKRTTSTAGNQNAGTSLGIAVENVTSGTAAVADILVRLR